MTDDVENIILLQLKAIRAKLDQLSNDGVETRSRRGLTYLEERSAHLLAQHASVSSRLDLVTMRLARIAQWIELVVDWCRNQLVDFSSRAFPKRMPALARFIV